MARSPLLLSLGAKGDDKMRPGSIPSSHRRVPIALALLVGVVALIGARDISLRGDTKSALLISVRQTDR